ncbi:MAG: putative transposase [Cyclobacteriaceae bacterium]|jgi:REP element-mobilizing transposase RayT
MKGLEKFEPETYYHIINHAVGSENLFRTEDNYRYFLKRYAHYMPSVCSTLAYCLMPNQIHFLVKNHNEETLLKNPKYKTDFHKLVMQRLSNLLNAYDKA